MALSLDMLESDFAEMVADLPHYLRFNDSETEVVFSGPGDNDAVLMAGVDDQSSAQAWYPIDSEKETPDVGDVVEIATGTELPGVRYRVQSIEDSPCGKVRRLVLVDEQE